ncbi:MAG: hypothetical protein ABFQ65_02370 [Nanoarchaeota archaeon]
MKKWLSLISGLFLISFVSAAYYPASLQNILDSLDPSTVILGSIFIIFFILINFALSRAFKGQKGIAGILAFILSFLIIYGLNRSGFDYQNIYYDLFYNIGLSSGVASTFLPLIVLAAAVFIVWKFSLWVLLLMLGIFIIIYGFAFAYESVATVIIGGIFIIASLVIKKKPSENSLNKKSFFSKPQLNPNWKGDLKSSATWAPKKMYSGAKKGVKFTKGKYQARQQRKAQEKTEKEEAKKQRAEEEKQKREKAKQSYFNIQAKQHIKKLQVSWQIAKARFIQQGESKDPIFKKAYKELMWRYDSSNQPIQHPDIDKTLRNIQTEIKKIYNRLK